MSRQQHSVLAAGGEIQRTKSAQRLGNQRLCVEKSGRRIDEGVVTLKEDPVDSEVEAFREECELVKAAVREAVDEIRNLP